MEPLVHFLIVVIEVQSRGSQVMLICIVHAVQSRGNDGVNTRRKARFMDRFRLIKIVIFSVGIYCKVIPEEIETLKYIGLLDENERKIRSQLHF